ncbi:Forkhead associated domain [Teratosphaeria destructans]|uniref:Forkhead associated domain n=1 Tax=Teratosphaeria destructans TaxID=418781 RepID=A0A9W7STM2_9PEZI|nr:Forkhead associated domain [Teratosphaeria destructans]
MPPLLMNPNLDMLSAALAVPQQRTSILGQNQGVHFTFEQKHAAAFPDKRHLTIEPGQTLIISRASKSKDSMSPKITNLLYDCPVMSRAHAELKHNRFAPLHEQITITDRDSKHGTSVNDKRLEPHKPFALRSGDIVKLGGKVVSGSGMFVSNPSSVTLLTVAQKYMMASR